MRPIARFAWGLLAYEIGVIAWGAYVRATGSGAGCGNHWPLCKGEVVPRLPSAETLIELSHRLSSGLALALTLLLFAWARRVYPIGHRVRLGAGAVVSLMITEALIGAVLVLFALVAHDASLKRALGTSLHLVNTFLLLAATSLTAWWASGGEPVRLWARGALAPVLALSLLATLLVATSGALTALGDTLFPSASVASGLTQDWAAGAPMYVRLRVLHPMLAVATAAIVLVAMTLVRTLRCARAGDHAARSPRSGGPGVDRAGSDIGGCHGVRPGARESAGLPAVSPDSRMSEGRSGAFVLAAHLAGLADDDACELGKARLYPRPNPAREKLARRVLEARYVV